MFHTQRKRKSGATILKPVFDEFYINTEEQYCGTITAMIVSDRHEEWTIYENMSKCPFSWLYR
jgi:hypothetical protein